jgi:type III restriction enzyme
MMPELRLKNYQQMALEKLRDYFKFCVRFDSAELAFTEIYKNDNYSTKIPSYNTALEELKGLPYVCLRLPTGAGKTILASHTPGVALRHLLYADRCVVLWLVTSETILRQTLDALKEQNHPYRIALERGVGAVTIMNIDQAIGINRAKLNGDTVVIVSTIQAFRRDKPEWLRVHRDSSANMDIFERWGEQPEDIKARLEKLEGGDRPLYSLANALCLRRPVVIVDEAHNAKTPLSFETLAKIYPSCIIEFTATPKESSNVIHTVSAAELDAEEMIKMPIRLETRPQWKELLSDAIRTRDRLEQQARKEQIEKHGDYIRPVMLLQAQKINEEITYHVLFECLKSDYNIPEEQIAIATSDKDTLLDQDVMSPDCPLRYIITVDKLREGWDCPFAYVLTTVREMKSSTAIEQILGRVMRLPYARKKKIDDLNRAYAFSVSDHIQAALGNLRESLVEIGFEKTEVKNMVLPSMQSSETGDFFGFNNISEFPAITVHVPESLNINSLSENARRIVSYEEATETLIISAPMTEPVMQELKAIYKTPEGIKAVNKAYNDSQKLNRERSPVEMGIKFDVPLLCYKQGDFLEPFEEIHFLDHPWDLKSCDASLSEKEFPSERTKAETGEVFQEEGHLRTRFVSLIQEQMERISNERGWSQARLVKWLDENIIHKDISHVETGVFLTSVINYLITERVFMLDDLVYEKYRLKDALEKKIDNYRKAAHKKVFQTLLIDESPLVVELQNPMALFSYTKYPHSYGTHNRYRGNHIFKKHFYPNLYELQSEGEEFECACFIDSIQEIECWVRNIPRLPDLSFWLQTSTDRCYPDFVCKLKDGRILALEYKSERDWSNDDSREKRQIGELWELRSNGSCLFIMPNGKKFDEIQEKTSMRSG